MQCGWSCCVDQEPTHLLQPAGLDVVDVAVHWHILDQGVVFDGLHIILDTLLQILQRHNI